MYVMQPRNPPKNSNNHVDLLPSPSHLGRDSTVKPWPRTPVRAVRGDRRHGGCAPWQSLVDPWRHESWVDLGDLRGFSDSLKTSGLVKKRIAGWW